MVSWSKDVERRTHGVCRRLTRNALAKPVPSFADPVRRKENLAGSHPSDQAVVTDGRQAHRGDAAALGAVGIAAKLTGGHSGFEIGRNSPRGSGKDALLRIRGRCLHLDDHRVRHVQSWKARSYSSEFSDDGSSLLG